MENIFTIYNFFVSIEIKLQSVNVFCDCSGSLKMFTAKQRIISLS